MTLPEDHPLRAGVDALSDWLTAHKTNPNRFAVQHGIDPSTMSKLMRGVTRQLSMDVAHRIARATRDEVPLAVWTTEKKDDEVTP